MNLFSAVKKAVTESHEQILSELGLQVRGFQSGVWSQCLCPLCDDRSGSASVTTSGFVKCWQCNIKLDLFQWLGRKEGCTPWEAAKKLAERFKIPLEAGVRTRRAGALPLRMTEDILDQSIDELWSSQLAQPARDFLEDRKLTSDPDLLAQCGVGFMKGFITFAQRDLNGRIQERYRGYLPNGNVKWQWFGRGTGGPAIWLAHQEALDRVLLLEGEWDVLTALVRLRLHEHGWTVATWTAGAGSSPSMADIPKTWHDKDVHICYDNDVFQGPKYNEYWCKDKKGEQKLVALRKNLLGKVAPTFTEAGCHVWIRQVPIDPKEIWGGDFRDWVDRGGSNLNDLPLFRYSALPSVIHDEQVLEFDELWDSHIGERIRTRTQVSMVAGDDYIIPTLSQLRCQLGQLSACNSCGAPKLFPDGLVPLDGYAEQVAVGIAGRDMEDYIIKHVIKKPRSCPEARLTTIEGKSGSYWRGVRPGASDDTRQRALTVVSSQPPSMSGEVEIAGTLHSRGEGLVFSADQVFQLDRAEIDLSHVHRELEHITPHKINEPTDIDEYLDERWRDISSHQTRVFGRRDVHVACELLFHSVTGIRIDGKVRRGWLDIAMMGDTRTGKSMTIRGLIDWLHLGSIHSAVDNISRAGLIMGGDHNGMMRPGLLTKSHRKLLALDEFHWIVNSKKLGEDHPMSWMQSARDEGKVFGVKIYGDRILPAKVRLLTISNWAKSRRRSFTYACEHLYWLYGSPETISRLDFGLIVQGPPTQFNFDEVEEKWTCDRAKALVLRAWSQEPGQIVIEDDAQSLAFAISDSWKHMFAYDKIALYTPEEKPFSILRIATAVANICYSRLEDDPYSVLVKPVHVRWACNWLRQCWLECDYETYSQSQIIDNRTDTPFSIERCLLINLKLDDPSQAARVLNNLLQGAPEEVFRIIIPTESDLTLFMTKALRVNIIKVNSEDRQIELTDAAHDICVRLAGIARSNPEVYMERYRKLLTWSQNDKDQPVIPIQFYGET